MTSETKPLTGLELRKACLIAAGWHTDTWPEEPEFIKLYSDRDELWGNGYDTNFKSEHEAWGYAPKVESSVDAALEYLRLPDGWEWTLRFDCRDAYAQPIPPVYEWALWNPEGELASLNFIKAATPAEAICLTWLEWKTA